MKIQLITEQHGFELCRSVLSLFFFFSFIFYQLEANYFTILQWVLPYIDMNQPWIYMYSPSRSPLPPPSLSSPSGSSQCTSPEHLSHASNGLVICFTLGNIHVLMPFSQIIPLSPSPIESKSLFNTSVSLFLSCIQDYRYHLSKFHIYVLVYCIGSTLAQTFFNKYHSTE